MKNATRCFRSMLAVITILTALSPAPAQRAFLHRFESIPTNTRYFGFFKAAAAADGGWAVANCDSATRTMLILRFDSCGDLAWSKQIIAENPFRPLRCSDVFFDPDGDLVTGFYVSSNDFGYFHLIKLDPAGEFRWKRSWKADRLGPGVFSMGMLASGHYFFSGTNHPPSGPRDFIGITDTAGQLLSVRTYYESSAGYQTVATALRDGHLLVRRGPVMYKIDPLAGTVFWYRGYLAPMYNQSKPLELTDGFMVVGQFANSVDLHSAVPVFFAADGVLQHAGEMFRANGGFFASGGFQEIRRVEALADGNFVTVTTDSLPAGYISIVVFAPSGHLVRQTFIPSGLPGIKLLNHDFCLLEDGGLAIAADAGGRLVVLRTAADPHTLCGARSGIYSVPYQTSLSEDAIDLSVDTFPFEPVNVDFTLVDFEGGRSIVCDTIRQFPDRDTTLSGCPGDTLWADAFHPGASRYAWENGSDSGRVRILPGQERVATVWTGCHSFKHRFNAALRADCLCPVEMPTVFTPNGDLLNETLRPVAACGFDHYSLSIFNRWGQRVFTSREPDAGWNGQTAGRDQPADVYIYLLEYSLGGSGIIQQQGEATLLR
jgi:gliding motility-associated-like protein